MLSLGVQMLSILVPYLRYEAPMVQEPDAHERLLWHPAYSPRGVAPGVCCVTTIQ